MVTRWTLHPSLPFYPWLGCTCAWLILIHVAVKHVVWRSRIMVTAVAVSSAWFLFTEMLEVYICTRSGFWGSTWEVVMFTGALPSCWLTVVSYFQSAEKDLCTTVATCNLQLAGNNLVTILMVVTLCQWRQPLPLLSSWIEAALIKPFLAFGAV